MMQDSGILNIFEFSVLPPLHTELGQVLENRIN